MIALIDGDMMCYRIGFSCNEETEEVALKTLDSFLCEIMSELLMELEDGASLSHEMFLTGQGNFRDDYAVTAPYKGNRSGMEKPIHLQALRNHLLNSWDGYMANGEEADDAIAIRATQLEDEAVIVSLDKDFDQVKGWHYNFLKQSLYYITEEEGIHNFYCQFLTGDRVDNIIGVKGIGPVKANKLLADKDVPSKFSVCVEKLGYERAVENGRLLYLRREPDELWQPPLTEKECQSQNVA